MITVAGLIPGQRATFEGRVNEVEDISKGRRTLRAGRRRRQQRRDHRHVPSRARRRRHPARPAVADHRQAPPERQPAHVDDRPGLPRGRGAGRDPRGERELDEAMAAVLVSVVSFAFTANGYRPLTKHGYGSLYAFGYGVFASELPMQVLGAQLIAQAAVLRRLPTRIRRFSWLMSALSWLGLAGSAPPRAQGQRAADRGAGRRVGHRPSQRVGRSVAAARARRRDREETRRGAHAADLPRLRARRRHQLRGGRLAEPSRHLAAARLSTATDGRRCCCRFPGAPG